MRNLVQEEQKHKVKPIHESMQFHHSTYQAVFNQQTTCTTKLTPAVWLPDSIIHTIVPDSTLPTMVPQYHQVPNLNLFTQCEINRHKYITTSPQFEIQFLNLLKLRNRWKKIHIFFCLICDDIIFLFRMKILYVDKKVEKEETIEADLTHLWIPEMETYVQCLDFCFWLLYNCWRKNSKTTTSVSP